MYDYKFSLFDLTPGWKQFLGKLEEAEERVIFVSATLQRRRYAHKYPAIYGSVWLRKTKEDVFIGCLSLKTEFDHERLVEFRFFLSAVIPFSEFMGLYCAEGLANLARLRFLQIIKQHSTCQRHFGLVSMFHRLEWGFDPYYGKAWYK